MRPRLSAVLGLVVVASALAHGPCAPATEAEGSDAAAWRVGVARRVITPTEPVWLAGYGTSRAPEGKLHDLWAKTLAFEAADGGRAVLITSDFQGVPAKMSDRVFARLSADHGLDRARVMFAYSHNHSSPRLGDDLLDYYPVDPAQEALVERDTTACVETCVGLVADALAALAPATVRVGTAGRRHGGRDGGQLRAAFQAPVGPGDVGSRLHRRHGRLRPLAARLGGGGRRRGRVPL